MFLYFHIKDTMSQKLSFGSDTKLAGEVPTENFVLERAAMKRRIRIGDGERKRAVPGVLPFLCQRDN